MSIDIDLSGAELAPSIYVPQSIRHLHRRLGQLWVHNDHPLVANLNGRLYGLFEFQNQLIGPQNYEIDEFGVVNFWTENQGVFNYGYVEGDNFAYADLDWMAPGLTVNDLPPPPSPPDQMDTCWGRTPLTIEQAIIGVLLSDFLLMFGTNLPPNKRLTQTKKDVTVWDSALWPAFKFWANAAFEYVTDGTTLLYRK